MSSVIRNAVKLRSGPTEQVDVMKKLLQSAKGTMRNKMIQQVVATKKYTGVSNCADIIHIRSLAEDLTSKEKVTKTCYLGEELFLQQNIFFILAPPKVKKLAAGSHSMMESGLYFLWYREFTGLVASPRVQSRHRMVSPTKLLKDAPPPQALKLEGKLRNVFVLWIICWGVCLFIFVA